jgi:putative membrane protein
MRRSKAEGRPVGLWRAISFFVGLALIYFVLQSYYDYLSQHMFWIHRLQHLVLHHVGPFLIVLGGPQLIARGLPDGVRDSVAKTLWRNPVVRGTYRVVQHPVVAPVLFVGLIYFWLTPAIHFDAMLNLNLYKAMNWSMAIDGLLFWWLMLSPKSEHSIVSLGYGTRILLLWVVMVLQIIIGAYISLHDSVLYSVYNLCGRAWEVSPLVDQELGGLITWIPPSMMSIIGALLALGMWMHEQKPASAAQVAAGHLPTHGTAD